MALYFIFNDALQAKARQKNSYKSRDAVDEYSGVQISKYSAPHSSSIPDGSRRALITLCRNVNKIWKFIFTDYEILSVSRMYLESITDESDDGWRSTVSSSKIEATPVCSHVRKLVRVKTKLQNNVIILTWFILLFVNLLLLLQRYFQLLLFQTLPQCHRIHVYVLLTFHSLHCQKLHLILKLHVNIGRQFLDVEISLTRNNSKQTNG